MKSVFTQLQGSFINIASAAEILHIYNLAIMKLCRSGEEVWELLYAASVEIADIGIEVIIEKLKEFRPKVTGEMSIDQHSQRMFNNPSRVFCIAMMLESRFTHND